MESTYLCLLLQKSGLIIIFILLLILLLCEEYFCFHKNIPRDTRTSMFTAVIVLFHLLDTTSIQMVHVLERRFYFTFFLHAVYGMYLLLIPLCKPMHFYLISRRINLELCVCNQHISLDRQTQIYSIRMDGYVVLASRTTRRKDMIARNNESILYMLCLCHDP